MNKEKLNFMSFIGLRKLRQGVRERWKEFSEKRGSFVPETSYGRLGIHYDAYSMSWKEWGIGGVMGLGGATVIAYTFYRSMAVFGLLLPLVGICPLYYQKKLKYRRLRELQLQFKEWILLLSASLRAGYSIENALSASKKELELLYGPEGMMVVETAYMVKQLGMNRSVEEVLTDFAVRSGLEDVENFAGIFAASKRSGGQLIPVIQHTAASIHDKIQVQEEIRTLTASRKFEQQIMNLIPFLIIFYIDGTSPGFFQVMYETWMGRVVMTGCLLTYLAACVISGKVLAIRL